MLQMRKANAMIIDHFQAVFPPMQIQISYCTEAKPLAAPENPCADTAKWGLPRNTLRSAIFLYAPHKRWKFEPLSLSSSSSLHYHLCAFYGCFCGLGIAELRFSHDHPLCTQFKCAFFNSQEVPSPVRRALTSYAADGESSECFNLRCLRKLPKDL